MEQFISNEITKKVHEYIICELFVNLLEKRIKEADSEGFKEFLEIKLKQVLNEKKELKKYMRDNKIKVTDPQPIEDGMFILYKYYVGNKSREMRYWRYAIKLHLKKRYQALFEIR